MRTGRYKMGARLQHVDIARGVGILFVVLGHNWLLAQNGKLLNVVYSFHMPLFFFLAGVFFKEEGGLREMLIAKTDSLLKPYFVTLGLLGAVFFLEGNSFSVGKYILGVIYGNGGTLPWVPMWFLTHLWILFVFSFLLARLLKIGQWNPAGNIVLLGALLVCGVYAIKLFWMIHVNLLGSARTLPGLPFSLDLLPLTSFYFLLGVVLKEKVVNLNYDIKYFLLCLAAFVFLHAYFNDSMDLNARRYDDLIVSTVEALCGIYVVLSVSCILRRKATLGVVLAYVGSRSIFVLMFHNAIQENSFSALSHVFRGQVYSNWVFAFVLASTIPLLVSEVIRSNSYLAMLWMPIKSNKLFQRRVPAHS